MIDGSLVAASWADFAAGRFTVPPPRPDIITGELSSTGDRICMAWGLSTEQIDAALVACDDLGADVSVHAGLSGPAQLFTLTETGALVPCEKP